MGKITLSVIKADIGSIGGHIEPSAGILSAVNHFIGSTPNPFIDFNVSFTGDDIAILSTHALGNDNELVHEICYKALVAGAEKAKEEGLYGAGQDLLKDTFSGNVKGMGPAVAEMTFEARRAEPFILFAADKTDPGAYNLMLYLGFADPMYCSGLILAPGMKNGFEFTIMDVSHTDGDKVIRLNAPEDLYNIAALLRDPERFVIKSIHTRDGNRDIAAVVSTTRLSLIAGKYVGKDDPVSLVRLQSQFPATGEILSPYVITPLVAGFMRGSHTGPLMPVKRGTSVSYFDGPPIVSGTAYCIKDGKLTQPSDVFNHPFWDEVRREASQKAMWIRRQGFFGPAMLPYSELEYGGIVEKMEELEGRFIVE